MSRSYGWTGVASSRMGSTTRHACLHLVLAGEQRRLALDGVAQQPLVRASRRRLPGGGRRARCPRPPWPRPAPWPATAGRCTRRARAGTGWCRRGCGRSVSKMSSGGLHSVTTTSVVVIGMHLPARMKNGTPAQRQLSMCSRRAANVSTVESGATPSSSRVAVELAAHDVGSASAGASPSARRPARCGRRRGRAAWGAPSPAASITCSRWFWMTSRMQPGGVVEAAAVRRRRTSSAIVICTLST